MPTSAGLGQELLPREDMHGSYLMTLGSGGTLASLLPGRSKRLPLHAVGCRVLQKDIRSAAQAQGVASWSLTTCKAFISPLCLVGNEGVSYRDQYREYI